MIDLISRTVIFILCFNFLITGCEPLPTYGATDVDYYRIVTNSLFYPTAECFPWEDSFCRKYPPEKEHEVIWIPHNLLNCSASVSAVSSSQEYSTLSSLPDQLPLQTCMNGNTSLSCELLCKPYYRGKWCSDFASCRFPLYILAKIGNLSEKVANGKTEKRIPLLPLHAFDRHQNIVTNSERDQTSSPISYCLRSLDSYSNSNSNSTMTSKSPEFLMMFLGDSQTQMLLFTFLRWLSGGEVQPSWDMIYRRNRIISSAGFKFQIAKYFIRDISDTSHPIKSPTNVTKILEFVRSKRHVAKKGLIVLGHGVWDLTNSNNDNILSSFEKRFRYELAEIIAAAACNYESVDIFVRNMWVSIAVFFNYFLYYNCTTLPVLIASLLLYRSADCHMETDWFLYCKI